MLFEKLLQFTLPRLNYIQTPDIKSHKIPMIIFKDFQKESELNKQKI
jgi:hypothetical protein